MRPVAEAKEVQCCLHKVVLHARSQSRAVDGFERWCPEPLLEYVQLFPRYCWSVGLALELHHTTVTSNEPGCELTPSLNFR